MQVVRRILGNNIIFGLNNGDRLVTKKNWHVRRFCQSLMRSMPNAPEKTSGD